MLQSRRALQKYHCGGDWGVPEHLAAEPTEPEAEERERALTAHVNSLYSWAPVALADSEKILLLAQASVDAAEQLLLNGNRVSSRACPQGGATTTDLNDNDNDDQLGVGDDITMRYTNCLDTQFGATLDGLLTLSMLELQLDTQTLGTPQLRGMAGILTANDFLSVTNAVDVSIDADFAVRFSRLSGVKLSASAADVQAVSITSAGGTDSYRAFNLQKNVAEFRDDYELQLEMQLDSDTLDAVVDCNDFALLGRTSLAPDSGELNCRATTGAAVSLNADGLPSLSVDADGDGVFEVVEQPTRLFNEAANGFLYAQPDR